MTTTKDIKKSNGLFGIGGKSEIMTYEEYTMDGANHIGANLGKLNAKTEECIKAAGGGEQTGKMVGASMVLLPHHLLLVFHILDGLLLDEL